MRAELETVEKAQAPGPRSMVLSEDSTSSSEDEQPINPLTATRASRASLQSDWHDGWGNGLMKTTRQGDEELR
jgi:hypothetical protein